MDAILDFVQFGLLVIAALAGVIGVVLLVIDRRHPKRKTSPCWKCAAWSQMEMDYGRCLHTGKVCRAGQRACQVERRGK